MPSLLSVLPLHLTIEKIFWFVVAVPEAFFGTALLCSAVLSTGGGTVQSDLFLKPEYTDSLGSYLQQSSGPNACQRHFMIVVVQILLKDLGLCPPSQQRNASKCQAFLCLESARRQSLVPAYRVFFVGPYIPRQKLKAGINGLGRSSPVE